MPLFSIVKSRLAKHFLEIKRFIGIVENKIFHVEDADNVVRIVLIHRDSRKVVAIVNLLELLAGDARRNGRHMDAGDT